MAREEHDPAKAARAHSVLLRLALPSYTVHFKSPAYLQPTTLDLLDKKVCKEILKATGQVRAVREAIGTDVKFWEELLLLLQAAVPSLERRSFSIWDPSSVDYESTSGALIAANYPGLWRDLERLNDLIGITRNVLTIGDAAQDLAAEHRIDHDVFRLINCCVRVTARGYDGDAGTGDEEKWQLIVKAYKELLITSVQFLNNLVARNEKGKLLLWVSLFDSALDGLDQQLEDEEEEGQKRIVLGEHGQELTNASTAKPSPPISGQDILLAYGTNGSSRVSPLEYEAAIPIFQPARGEGFSPLPPQITNMIKKNIFEPNGYVYYVHVNHADVVNIYQTDHKRSPSLGEIHRAVPTLWKQERLAQNRSEKKMWEHWQGMYAQALTNYRRELEAFDQGEPLPMQKQIEPKGAVEIPSAAQAEPETIEERIQMLEEQLREKYTGELRMAADMGDAEACRTISECLDSLDQGSIGWVPATALKTDDLRMEVSAETGVSVLENGKAELMKKLEGHTRDDLDGGEGSSRSLVAAAHHRRRRSAQSLSDAFAPESLGSEDEEDEDESDEEDDDDYPGSSEDGRGLLTDVPLILGPTEIDTLPMLVMSAIVPAPESPTNSPTRPDEPASEARSTHTLRTHLLLSQTAGRNLLRELLIFVAAWDLRESEQYFKFMVKIMEAILKNGLMPYAYHAFRDRSRSKDIISPAQAVIMKLLTCIFRERNAGTKEVQQLASMEIVTVSVPPPPPGKVELHILNFIFTEFRQHIIPQTCALIFLQGQIHKGRASPEDFPLNLWDMERMYEGVYQFLEFFAVLAEEQISGGIRNDDGKAVEGDKFSWKKILTEWEMASELVTLLRELEGGIPKMIGSMPLNARGVPVPPPAPQRSLSADAATMPAISMNRPFELDDSAIPTASSAGQIFEAETPLAYPEDPIVPTTIHDQDEPSDFEWRNLKKLTVLVLSSLIWKNKQVQDQVRTCGGLEALVACCKHDEHNPYIREHAIMCLRFAVEGNDANAEVIRSLADQYAIQAAKQCGLLENDASDVSVPREVLDTNGYETFMDSKGQVGLRRKDKVSTLPLQPADRTASSSAPPQAQFTSRKLNELAGFSNMTAEKAAELMQNALRDLSLGDKVTNQQKAEALAKLDRAFESTEKAFGKGKKG